jgi:hypothetical protein
VSRYCSIEVELSPSAIPDLLASYSFSEQLSSIEDMIAQGADLHTVVRLLCLASLTNGGIKSKTLDNLKREILQVCSAPDSYVCAYGL